MKFENERQLSVRCFKCGCFGHRGVQCENIPSDRRSLNPNAGMLEKCWICGCLGHIAVECKEKTVTCFSCGERGHKQEDCTSPMANCWNCGKRGHIKKGCPWKKNVGMCFYCHKVGHHSKDCDQKVCYICSSKDHLWTRCPLKGLRGGYPPRPNGQYGHRRMRHVPRGQNYPKAFQPTLFPNASMLENQYYQSVMQQEQQNPRCIRPKSNLFPLSAAQERTLAAQGRNPMPIRRNSDPAYHSDPLGPQQEQWLRSHSVDEIDMVLPFFLRSASPNFGLGSDTDQKGFEGLDMADIIIPSDESLMKVTESEQGRSQPIPSQDGSRMSYCTELLKSTSSVWSEIAPKAEPGGGQTWGNPSSEVWRTWDNGLHVELTTPEGSSANMQNGKTVEQSGSDGVDLASSEVKSVVETGRNEGEEGEICSVQEQQTRPAQQTQDSEGLAGAVADTTGGSTSSVTNTIGPSPCVTSTSPMSSHLSESTELSGTPEDLKPHIDEGVVVVEATEMVTAKPAENDESRAETQETDTQEELKRAREQLAVAKAKLVETEEQLDKTQRMVQGLKNVMYLESLVKKKFCQEEHSTKGDVENRCANCIQILKKLESCKECV